MARAPDDGRGRLGGRAKGTPNRNTQILMDKADELGVDPFEILLRFAKGDWKGLGYKAARIEKLGAFGHVVFDDVIDPEMRLAAAEKACQYLHPKRKAIDLKTDSGGALKEFMSMDPEERRELIKLYSQKTAQSSKKKKP